MTKGSDRGGRAHAKTRLWEKKRMKLAEATMRRHKDRHEMSMLMKGYFEVFRRGGAKHIKIQR